MLERTRWQVLVALVALGVILGLLAHTAYSRTMVIVPDFGGTYIEGVAGNPRYINPLLCYYNTVDRDLVALIFGGLTTANERGEIVPDLATDWQISDDNLVYTFHLRDGVRWHDGVPFTADDVLFTIHAIQDPDFQGLPALADLWRSVKVEAPDAHTVRFTLQEPFAPFLDYTTIGILPAHLLADVPAKLLPDSQFNAQPIGTGPFELAEISAEHALLEANTHYYDQRPLLDKIEFRFYPDYPSVVQAYQRGEVHGICRVLPEQLEEVRRDETLTLYTAPLSGYTLVFLNLDRPFFRDARVRQALLWATDRQGIVDRLLNGQGIVAHSPIMPSSWAYDPNILKYTYDPAKAEALLNEAGWLDMDGDGVREKEGIRLEFALLTNDDPTRVRIIEELARQWGQVGVKAIPQTAGVAGVVRDFLVPRQFDALLYAWQSFPPDPDPYPQWHVSQIGEDGQNFSGYNNDAANLVMEEARVIADRSRRAELYKEFQRYFAEDVPSLLLYYPVYNYAISKTVFGVQVGPMIEASDRFRTVTDWYMLTKRVILSESRWWEFDKPSKE
ncbi:MAG: peptide ABC transporter substrate-binding protein [Chloroflexi bacterium]|nr:peptide ABC transporter substrate-binding protein [Chloroflexota bacterium]